MQNWIIEFQDWDNFHAETEAEAIEKFKDQYGSSAEILNITKDG